MLNVHEKPGYVVLEIDRPPLNILTMDVLERMREALARVAASDARGLLLCASGKCFSAGADIAEHLPGTVERMIPLFTQTLMDLLSIEIPTIAHVHGSALGGGFEAAFACDIVVAAEDARLGLPEIALGVFPPAAAALLPLQIGERRALELMLTGDVVSAEAALEMGLVNRVGTRADAVQLLERIIRHPRPALVACKRAARSVAFRDRLRFAERKYNELMQHTEPIEGLKAFLEKRPPTWARGNGAKP